MAAKAEQIIADFLDCWHRRDLEGLVARVTQDVAFQPDPGAEMVRGREAVGALWAQYLETMLGYEADIRQLAAGQGVVFVERVERLSLSGGRRMELPIVGVFELDPAGQIRAWRDYWDPAMAKPV